MTSFTPVLMNQTGNVLYDTTNWSLLTAPYTATGGEDWLTIGNFYDNSSGTAVHVYGPTVGFAYYYIDDVSVTNPGFFVYGPPSGCPGDTFLFQAFNSSNYWWSTLSNPGDTLSTDSVLVVTPTVTTTYLCHSAAGTDTITATVNGPLVNLGPDDTTFCYNTAFLDAGNPGSTYLWSTGDSSQYIFLNQPGDTSVWVMVTDSNGCVAADTLDFYIYPQPSVNLGNDTALCDTVMALEVSDPALSYLWSTGDTTTTTVISNTGTYWIELSNQGCRASDTITVTLLSIPVVNLGEDTTLCEGTLMLDAGNSGASYLWSDNSTAQTTTISASGSYWVEVDNGSCRASDTITVTFNPPPVVYLGADTSICEGPYVLNAGSFTGYHWSTGALTPSITVYSSGTYAVAVFDGSCYGRDTAVITVKGSPQVELGGDTLLCPGGTIILNAYVAGATYRWSDGSEDPELVVNKAGSYGVTVTKDGCTGTDQLMVSQAKEPDLDPLYSLCEGEVELDAGVPGEAYWSTGEQTPVITVREPGEITLELHHGHCVMYDTTLVEGASGEGVYLPNAFKPNSDGLNDYFPGTVASLTAYELNIYNRYGEVIFKSTDPSMNWDGTFQNMECPVGTYVYTVTWASQCETRQTTRSGIVTLLR